jgi:hypothetical protein
MIIIGCDFHTRFQQIAMLEVTTGELVEARLDDINRPSHGRTWPSQVHDEQPWRARRQQVPFLPSKRVYSFEMGIPDKT